METQQLIVGIVAALAAVIAAVLGAPRVLRDERWSINRDLEIYKALPEQSTAREALLRKIDREIVALDTFDQRRRNPMGISLGIVFSIMGAAGAWFVFISGGWWWLLLPVVAAALVTGFVGFGISVRKTLRDESGNTIPKLTPPKTAKSSK